MQWEPAIQAAYLIVEANGKLLPFQSSVPSVHVGQHSIALTGYSFVCCSQTVPDSATRPALQAAYLTVDAIGKLLPFQSSMPNVRVAICELLIGAFFAAARQCDGTCPSSCLSHDGSHWGQAAAVPDICAQCGGGQNHPEG